MIVAYLNGPLVSNMFSVRPVIEFVVTALADIVPVTPTAEKLTPPDAFLLTIKLAVAAAVAANVSSTEVETCAAVFPPTVLTTVADKVPVTLPASGVDA